MDTHNYLDISNNLMDIYTPDTDILKKTMDNKVEKSIELMDIHSCGCP